MRIDNMQHEVLERSILGTMLTNNYLINDSTVQAEHFTGAIHRKIYQTMKHLADKQQVADIATIIVSVQNIEEIGGDINYLSSLESFADIEKFDSWAETLLESYQKRTARNLMNKALVDDWELDKVLGELSKLEMHVENDRSTAYQEAQALFNMPFEDKPKREGIKTGIERYDEFTGGLIGSELTIIAARPSIGKSDVLINFAIGSQQKNENVLALIFSLEMSRESLSERVVCNIGKINRNKLKNPSMYFTEGQKELWPTIIGEYSKMNVEYYDKSLQTIAEIRSKVRKAALENPDKKIVVFIDYLTLIAPVDNKANTHVQVSQISRELKGMAKDFNAPVVCLAQLSRGVEQRQEKRPMLSDLRESGSIEQDADNVVLLYRDSYYDANKKDDKTLELNIAKQRAGQTGTIKTEYNRTTGRIT